MTAFVTPAKAGVQTDSFLDSGLRRNDGLAPKPKPEKGGEAASVTIVDLGYGNIGSIRVAFERLGLEPRVTADPVSIASARRLVLPGVGSASFAMSRIRQHGLEAILRNFERPLLGICLGMQLLFERSEEGETKCLGVIPGVVRQLVPAPGRPVPHMGWSRLSVQADGSGLRAGDYVYFAHSFAAEAGPFDIASADYGGPIPAAIRRRNFIGCQFHPERSSEAGARFLQAFVEQ